jgi:hypothetical protein
VTLASKGLVLLTAVLALATGLALGLPIAVLVLAAGALCLVIALAWASLEQLGGSSDLSLDEALSLAAPTAAEEQKRAVLRTLKDLEYERAVGKITEEDFRVASTHFRAEAKRLIAEADSSLSSRVELAEARVQKFLQSADLPGGAGTPKKGRKKAKAKSE